MIYFLNHSFIFCNIFPWIPIVAIRLYKIYLKKQKKKKQKNETVKREGLSSLEIMHICETLTMKNGC